MHNVLVEGTMLRTPIAIILFALSLFTAPVANAEQICVAAAISMKEALTDVAAAFKDKTGNDIQFAFNSSGALVAQIRNSRTIDLFISAAEKQMDDLQKETLIDPQSRRDIA